VLIGSVVRINNTEKQLMRLVKQNQLSVGGLVKCVECGTVDGSTNDMRKLAGNYVTDGSFAWQFAFVNTLADKRLRDESLSFEENGDCCIGLHSELAVFQGRRTVSRRVGDFC